MKSVIGIATIIFALSLCNLTGKRSNENGNANRPPSGTTEETSSSQATPQQQVAPSVSSGPPPSAHNRNTNMAAPGVPGGVPVSNTNSNASKPSIPKVVSGGVLNGKATYLPKPAYPAIAKAARASGTVTVQVLVDENGNVISASPLSGHPLLKQSAVQAARQAKFSPTKLSGQPVKVTGVVVYNFVAQ